MVASCEPAKIFAGDSVQWQKSFADYPANDGWVLSYILINASYKITLTGTAVGADHLISLTAAATAAYNAGKYSYQAYATKAATSARATVGTGQIEVVKNFGAMATATYDGRSHARKTLEAVEAVIENRATLDQQEYTIGDRTLKRTPLEELYTFRAQYRALVQQEERLENVGGGKPSRRRTRVRMR